MKYLVSVLWDNGLPVSAKVDWASIIFSLFKAAAWDPHPFGPANRLLRDVVTKLIPRLSQRHRSITFVLDVGEATCNEAHHSWEHARGMFAVLDACMVDLCRDPISVEGHSERNVQAWRRLQDRFMQKSLDPAWSAPPNVGGVFLDSPHGPPPSMPLLHSRNQGSQQGEVEEGHPARVGLTVYEFLSTL